MCTLLSNCGGQMFNYTWQAKQREATGLKNNGLVPFSWSDAPISTRPPPLQKTYWEYRWQAERKWSEGREGNVLCVRADLTVKFNYNSHLIFCEVKIFYRCSCVLTEQCTPTVRRTVQTLNLDIFFCWMRLSFALVLRWSLVFSAGLGFALVLLMDTDLSWGAGWRRWERERQGDWGPKSVTPGWRGRQEETQSSRGSGSTCAGQWQPVKLN